jgi:hypothetical protein
MREFTLIGVVLLIMGALALFRRRRHEVIAYLVGIASFLFVIIGYLNTPEQLVFLTEEFFTPLYLLTVVVIGCGISHLLLWARQTPPDEWIYRAAGVALATFFFMALPRLLCRSGYFELLCSNYLQKDPYLWISACIGCGLIVIITVTVLAAQAPWVKGVTVATVVVVSFALPTTLCLKNYYENDQHKNYIAFDYATNTLRSLPQGAVLFTWGDSGAFPLWYVQGVERMREDLDLLHTPHLVFAWYLDSFPHLFQHSILRNLIKEDQSPDRALQIAVYEQMSWRPVFIDFSTRYSLPFEQYLLRQRGITYQLEPRRDQKQLLVDPEVWGLYTMRGMSGGEMPFRDLDTGKAIIIYGYNRIEAGEYLLDAGRKPEAWAQFTQAIEIAPELRPQVEMILSRQGSR